jgi:hypothetical protein
VLMSLLGRRDLGMGAAMAASGESCRRCGHVLTARFDPLLPSAVQLFCAAKSLFDHLVGAQQN